MSKILDIVYAIVLVGLGAHKVHQQEWVDVFIISNIILLYTGNHFYKLLKEYVKNNCDK